MHLSNETLDEFITLYETEFKKKLSRAESSEMTFRVMTLYALLTKKLPNKQKPKPPDAPSV